MMFFTITLTALMCTVYASLFEWTLHRYFMHRKTWGLEYPVRQHAGVHHTTFKADLTYHLMRDEDKWTIPMKWWNGPFLILLSGIPFDLAGWYLGRWSIPLTAAVVIGAYYGAYEYLHWCMHLPKSRRLEFSWLFRKLNGHHLLHHRYMYKNFNVVLPLVDLCLGTLLTRSKVHFKQAAGPSVPDVQPKVPRQECVSS